MKIPNLGYHFARWEGQLRRRVYQAALPSTIARRIKPPAELPLDVYTYSNEAMLPEQVRSIRSLLRYAGRPQSLTVVSDGTHRLRSIELLQNIDPIIRVRPIEEFQPSDLPAKFHEYVVSHPGGKQLGLIMSLPRSGPTLYLDADILFFPGAADLSAEAQPNRAPALYLPDYHECSIDPRVLRGPNEHRNPVNCGFLLIFQKLDWSLCLKRFLELEGPPEYFTNQTLIHLVMHANGAKPLDPQHYVLQLSDQCLYRDRYAQPAIALRHYVNPVRHKFWNASRFA